MAPKDYRQLQVFIFFWAAHLEMIAHLKELEFVLGTMYNASITWFQIPSENPFPALEAALSAFQAKHASASNLLGVCYAGHGGIGLTKGLTLYESSSAGSPSLPWYPFQVKLVKCASDVFMFMHSCHTGATIANFTASSLGPGGGTTELLLACAKNETTLAYGKGSFIYDLIAALKKKAIISVLLFEDRPFAIETLRADLGKQPIFMRSSGDKREPIFLKPFTLSIRLQLRQAEEQERLEQERQERKRHENSLYKEMMGWGRY